MVSVNDPHNGDIRNRKEEKEVTISIYYDSDGNIIEDAENAFAEMKQCEYGIVYLCRTKGGRLVDPRNRSQEFRERLLLVQESGFRHYLNFLKTKTDALLSHAEREK